jgi:hypothetical protein
MWFYSFCLGIVVLPIINLEASLKRIVSNIIALCRPLIDHPTPSSSSKLRVRKRMHLTGLPIPASLGGELRLTVSTSLAPSSEFAFPFKRAPVGMKLA